MPSGSIQVRGLREFVRACDHSQKAVKKGLRDRLRAAGQIVRDEASRLLGRIYEPSAQSLKVYVRQRGVAVGQSRKTVTGKRPDFGALQMRFLLQARSAKFAQVEAAAESALDDVGV